MRSVLRFMCSDVACGIGFLAVRACISAARLRQLRSRRNLPTLAQLQCGLPTPTLNGRTIQAGQDDPMSASVEPAAFETALQARADEMASACTRCGKCFEACPITSAAGIADADPQAAIAGVLGIVRTGDGPEASRKWASSC